MHNGLYKQAACRSDSRIRHLFEEQGTHIALAVGQTSDSRTRPTQMMLPNCFYLVRLFFRIGIIGWLYVLYLAVVYEHLGVFFSGGICTMPLNIPRLFWLIR